MRVTARALVSVIIVACCSRNVAAAESKSWWPFGKHDDKAAAQTSTVTQPSAVAAPATTPLLAPQRTIPLPSTGASPTTPIPYQAQLPTTSAEAPKSKTWIKSPFSKVSLPKLPKPQLPQTSSVAQQPKAEAPHNSWVETPPAPPKTSPLQSMKNGAHKVSTSTKSAWNKTVDVLTPGESPAPSNPRIAKREVKPPLWRRMFGAKSELQGPQTVPEWMAQQRLDP